MFFWTACVYVVVQFYPWFKFCSPLFLIMVMKDNEFETKENEICTKDIIEPQHIHPSPPLFRNRTEIKEDGKPCVTRVTTVLFEEKNCSKPHLPLNRSFFVKDQKTLMLSEDHDETRK